MRSILGAVVLALVAPAVAGCSASADTSGDGASTSTTGTGGQGGAASACAVDCSQIDAGGPCVVAVCDEATGQCRVEPGNEGEPCDDQLFCTVGEACTAGLCGGGATNDRGIPVDPCKAIACDETVKACASAVANDGAPCATDNLCVVNSVCDGGTCTGAVKDCLFAPVGECGIATCNPANGECEGSADPSKNGLPCAQSGDKCMVDKTCNDGACEGGAPKDCSLFTQGCTNGLCDPTDGQCYADPIPEGGMCIAATDDCNVGICDNAGLCLPQPTNEGGACEDGNTCTLGETCASGVCQGGSMAGYEDYFVETFEDNGAGWLTDTEWQIGPAVSALCPDGAGDPGTDHTPTADNGIAGVVIGGCAATNVHPYYYLTSPVIDTSAAAGPVWLSLWRLLNSDYDPYMVNTIDVYDGAAWVTVWQSGTSPGIEDADWTQVYYDITAQKSAVMQIRFGVMVGSPSAVYSLGSWNIDDVVVANAVCN